MRLQTEFNLLSSRQVEGQLLQNRSEFYEHGEKAGKHLANQLRGLRAKQLIAGIRMDKYIHIRLYSRCKYNGQP